ncbi:hypothetical protein R0I52_00265 [Psychrobacter sp. CAM01]|jgi:hypothetical protein|uniref:hypothetical protein n=1 Tax=Psychrobacter sp. CAM01 TaxID=3080335 RepID=UPI0029358E03|nr:hypothetical protein [Psychrobacter sp. CAM01]MDV2859145.1 hypothetical protein [Psychrobacter sp. CAM01]
MANARKQTIDYKLKLDPKLHHWLKAHAAENYRTLSAEITMHLDKAYKAAQEESNDDK